MKVSLSAWALDSYKKVGALRGVARATESIGNVLYEQAKLTLIGFRVNVENGGAREKRGRTTSIAELAVTHEVRDISEMVVRAERRKKSRVLEVIYER
jgi:hypothetical protein